MEYAAGLLGTTVDCTELMRAGEVGDEEASAVSAALTIMREIWGDSAFTSSDVVKAMTPEWSTPTDTATADKAKAEALTEALNELVGKRLERPTAHSIGKLFQKRLVERPAWLGDGETSARLRKFKGHNANTYRVEVAAAGQDHDGSSAKTFSCVDPGQGHSPHSPHSPGRSLGAGELGNVGNVGNVCTDIAVNDVISSNGKRAKPGWSGRL